MLYQWSSGGSSTIRFNSIDGFCWGISTEGAIATIEGGWINNSARGIGLAKRYGDDVEADLTIENISINQTSQYGIISTASSKLTIGNSSVTNSSSGIHILHWTTASIYQCNISHNGVGVKTYAGTSTQASHSVYFDNSEGFHSEGTDQVFHNQFHSNANGVRVQAYSTRSISNNTITGSSVAGIWVYESSSANDIQNNEITQGYRGIWIWGASSIHNVVRWNNISDNHYGIHIESYGGHQPSSNTVERNNISFNEYGIYMYDAHQHVLRDNNISGNRYSGIYLDSVNSVAISESNISNNLIGIFVSGESGLSSLDANPPIHRNSILGNALWAIDSSILGELDASSNFFGAWNDDTIDEMISGNVIFYPWLGFRESNVDIVDFLEIIPPILSPYYVERGKIVNGSLLVGMNAEVIFNNSLGQNFIQINGVMHAFADSAFSSNYGNFTVIYLNGSQGSISQSTFEGQIAVSIQSTYVSVADSYLRNGTNGLIINQGENNTISGSGMTQNRNNGTYLFSSFWNDFTDNEILRNGDFGIRLDSSENNTISGRDVSTSDISCVHLSDSFNNTFSLLNITSCLHGIYSESSESNVYSSNNISSNDYGIQLVSGSKNSTIRQSNISNNFVGITVNSSYPSHINNNSILGNAFFAISAPSLSLYYLDAEHNYFGTNNSNQIAKLVTDHVDYTPWLPYRESNVTYIDNYTEWTTNQTLQGGIIVNETGCLNITGTQQNEVTVTFNSTHIQNFIQV
ncbi:MAG: right-handed parallel beta-helix repeat-containing protein, partial [Candidatus Thorarchaeota archaeon]